MARRVGKNRRCAAHVDGVSRFHTGTAYFELDATPALFDTAIRALAEGNSLRATGRIVQIDKDTASAWLHRAAVQCRLVMLYLWQGLSVTECQSYLVVELCAYQRAQPEQRQARV